MLWCVCFERGDVHSNDMEMTVMNLIVDELISGNVTLNLKGLAKIQVKYSCIVLVEENQPNFQATHLKGKLDVSDKSHHSQREDSSWAATQENSWPLNDFEFLCSLPSFSSVDAALWQITHRFQLFSSRMNGWKSLCWKWYHY